MNSDPQDYTKLSAISAETQGAEMPRMIHSEDEYVNKKYDYIPISSALIDHVRRINGFNVSTYILSIPDTTCFLGRRTLRIEKVNHIDSKESCK